jgi:hypothetical protein
MSENIAAAYQVANEAISANRRQFAEEHAEINNNTDLSAEAKDRYVSEARERAQAKHAEIVDAHEQTVAEQLEANERRLFGLAYPKDALTESQKEGFRTSYRQATLGLLGASEEIVARALARAHRTGDRALEQAAYHESIERGLSEVGDENRGRYPNAAEAWTTYVRDRRAAESRENIPAGALLKAQIP